MTARLALGGEEPRHPSFGGVPGPNHREPLGRTVAHRTAPLRPVPVDRLNAETSPEALLASRTPNPGFFVRSHFPTPAVRASSWKLSVGGAVRRPRDWTLAELRELPHARVVAALECAGNSRRRLSKLAEGELRWGDHAVGSAVWEGVPLRALLQRAEPLPAAREVVFSGADTGATAAPARRFSRSLTADLAAQDREILVATEMNGSPIPADHGWPARLVVPGWYGMAWVKWLTTIQVRTTPFRGYYQSSRYVYRTSREDATVVEPVARLRVKSLVVTPGEGTRVARGRSTVISGKAWSGSGPVTQVEVDVGSGWVVAQLTPGDGPYDWASWTYRWAPSRSGPTILRARATDADGATQPDEPIANDFQYGTNSIHRVQVVVA